MSLKTIESVINMKWTNRDLLEIALQQSAVDIGCKPADFLRTEPVTVISNKNPRARKYLSLPFECQLVSYGNNVVASVSEECRALTEAYIKRFPAEHCFETPNMHVLNDELQKIGFRICFMAEYFLPDLEHLTALECPYPFKMLHPADFRFLYLPEWSNALCEKRRELDVLGVGAYDGKKLIGLAACSADCNEMRQIGIDVLPEYRKQGVASALTVRLTMEILNRGKVPFYCAAWSNIKSVRNAITSGFRPAWVEMTAKRIDDVNEMNRR